MLKKKLGLIKGFKRREENDRGGLKIEDDRRTWNIH